MNYWNLTNQDEHVLEIQDPENWYKALVKWDGCIDFHRAYNLPFINESKDDPGQLVDCLHICDINDLIQRLQALKELAKIHFQSCQAGIQYWDDA